MKDVSVQCIEGSHGRKRSRGTQGYSNANFLKNVAASAPKVEGESEKGPLKWGSDGEGWDS